MPQPAIFFYSYREFCNLRHMLMLLEFNALIYDEKLVTCVSLIDVGS